MVGQNTVRNVRSELDKFACLGHLLASTAASNFKGKKDTIIYFIRAYCVAWSVLQSDSNTMIYSGP